MKGGPLETLVNFGKKVSVPKKIERVQIKFIFYLFVGVSKPGLNIGTRFQICSCNNRPAMHRDNFRLELANNRRIIQNCVFGKTQFPSDITPKFDYSAIFSNFRFLRGKTHFTSDITSKVRI